jgi:hypothetical protein
MVLAWMTEMRSILVGLCVVGMSSVAYAGDARNDIVEIRHGRRPNQVSVLGWTAQDAVVVRRTECVIEDGSGYPLCTITVTVATDRQRKDHVLFNRRWDGCQTMDPKPSVWCWSIEQSAASKLIKDEQALLESIGPLSQGSAVEKPFVIGSTQYAVRITPTPAGVYPENANIVVIEKGHATTLRSARGPNPKSLRWLFDATIDRLARSPDGKHLALIASYETRGADFYSTEHSVDVIEAR